MRTPNQDNDLSQEDVLGSIPQIGIDVFCENSDAASVIEAAAADRRMARASVKISMGGVARAVGAYQHATTPEVLIVETQGARDSILEQLDQLADVCDVNTKVIILGRVNDVLLYRELTRRGVSDYIAAPFDVYGIIRSIAELFAYQGNKPIGRTYAVMGVRGGAGGSTVAHNVGVTVARHFDVASAIIDFDLAFGTVGLNFNEDPMQNISDVIFDPDRADKVLVERLLVPHGNRINLLTAPCLVSRTYDLPERAADPILENVRLMVPAAVLDVPCGWAAWNHHTLLNADEIILVCTPDLGSLRSAKQLLDLLTRERPNDTAPKIVLNQVGMPRREEIVPAEFARGLGVELLGAIPFDAKAFSVAANNGKILMEGEVDAKISAEFVRITATLLGRKMAEPAKSSLFSRFTKK